MTQNATSHRDIYPDRPEHETRGILDGLASVVRGHRPDPEDPARRCLCGYDGESFDDHLAESTLREMKDLGYAFWPIRHV
jgi:hypothetical protein